MIYILGLFAGFVLGNIGYISYRILSVVINNKLVVRKANKLGTPDLCCCGSMLQDHGWGDNHAFVSEIDWFIESNTKQFS